ncbi:MAG: hypothetical protein KBC95_03075 [Candidatus Peribacteraceae bacterium]|nr:hypothetical protein [Candidatus Peribacteraceae bacterium]
MSKRKTTRRFAVYLHTAKELAWFREYVIYMGGKMFRPAETKGERPEGASAWDDWLRVGVSMPTEMVIAFVTQLPPGAKVRSDMSKLPTELL